MNYFIIFLMTCVVIGTFMWKRPARERYLILSVMCFLLCVVYYVFEKL